MAYLKTLTNDRIWQTYLICKYYKGGRNYVKSKHFKNLQNAYCAPIAVAWDSTVD